MAFATILAVVAGLTISASTSFAHDFYTNVLHHGKEYRPGEEVHLKGWLRATDPRVGGDVGALNGAVTAVRYVVRDSKNNEIAKGETSVNILGGWDARFTLPKTPSLGDATVELKASGRMTGAHDHDIQIEEFRRPEFEVKAATSEARSNPPRRMPSAASANMPRHRPRMPSSANGVGSSPMKAAATPVVFTVCPFDPFDI